MRKLRQSYRQILEAAGLPHGSKDLFHKLRRTSGTYLARATDELTAQLHLGHSHVSVTRRSYIDPGKLQRVQAALVMERPTLRAMAAEGDVA
jgi:integrase